MAAGKKKIVLNLANVTYIDSAGLGTLVATFNNARSQGATLAIHAWGAGDAAAGKAVYSNKCMICHGANGEGATGYAKAMSLEPVRLSSDRVQKKTDAELKKIMLEGSGKMKPVKGLTEIDTNNVIAYVRNFGKK